MVGHIVQLVPCFDQGTRVYQNIAPDQNLLSPQGFWEAYIHTEQRQRKTK